MSDKDLNPPFDHEEPEPELPRPASEAEDPTIELGDTQASDPTLDLGATDPQAETNGDPVTPALEPTASESTDGASASEPWSASTGSYAFPGLGWSSSSSWSSPPPPTPPTRSKRDRGGRGFSGLTVIVAAVVAAVVAAGTSLSVVKLTGSSSNGPVVIRQYKASPTSLQGTGLSGNGSLNVPEILAKVEPAVVDITAQGTSNSGFGGPTQFEDAGTGMIFSSNGLVLTNNHVILNATSIHVTLYNQTHAYPAKVVGTDPAHDVAVLKIEGVSHLPTVTFGSSKAIQVGDPVVAIGNALALQGEPTVTQGIVSALHRSISASNGSFTENLSDMIQTDAPINPGNSGGPLVNAQAQVVGMDTAIIASTSQTPAQNLGFAEAIDSVLPVVKNILKDPTYYTKGSTSLGPQTAFLGVGIQTMSAQAAVQLGYSPTQTGALIDYVYPGSPASNAGLTAGEVIIGFDGQRVADASQLVKDVRSKSPGQSVTLKILSTSGVSTESITLGNAPAA
jgi:S1-C subfamily serine protease